MFQARNIRAIHAVRKWQQFAFGFQFEIRRGAQKFLHHVAVFLRLQAASAVNQNAAGLQLRRGEIEQIELRRGSRSISAGWIRQRKSTRRRITPVLEHGASTRMRSKG
jgi:hypothetical protein